MCSYMFRQPSGRPQAFTIHRRNTATATSVMGGRLKSKSLRYKTLVNINVKRNKIRTEFFFVHTRNV